MRTSSCPEWAHSSSDPDLFPSQRSQGCETTPQVTTFPLSSFPSCWPLLPVQDCLKSINSKVSKSCTKPICWSPVPKESPFGWVFGNSARLSPLTQAGSSAWHLGIEHQRKRNRGVLEELTQLMETLQLSLALISSVPWAVLHHYRIFSAVFVGCGCVRHIHGDPSSWVCYLFIIFHADTELQLLRGVREVWGVLWVAFTFHSHLCFTLFVFLLLLLERCFSKQQW